MELIKELPELFEEFAEQRQTSFLQMKEIKEQNRPVIGAFCTYFPQEIAQAMGAATVGLCATSDETIPVAEQTLPKNLCPMIKASYGFAVTDKCPFFYFSDVVVGETTCDGKKKMYEYLAEFKNVFIIELPNSQSPDAMKLWKKEIIRFKEYLETKFDVEITEEKLRHAVRIENENRIALRSLYELQKHEPAPMSGVDLFNVLYGTTFKTDKEKIAPELYALRDKILEQYHEQNQESSQKNPLNIKKRILVTGCPSGGAPMKVVKIIEENGGVVVAYENCGGAKSIDQLVDENNPDVYEALAERYLNIGCSVMTPNPNRIDLMGRLLEEYKIDGVVEIILQACHTYNVEAGQIERFVKSKGRSYVKVETDYSQADIGQLNTRIGAFIEML